jgi:hypothetical protein
MEFEIREELNIAVATKAVDTELNKLFKALNPEEVGILATA